MLTLTDAISHFRLGLKVLAGLVVGGVFIYILVLVVRAVIPDGPPPPPQRAFGDLPEIDFPSTDVVASEFEYELNTISGALPALPDRLPVYKTVSIEGNLLALQNTRSDAGRLGFSIGEVKLSDTIYQWQKQTGEILKIDIVSRNFDIISSFLSVSQKEVLGGTTEKQLVTRVFSLLEGLNAQTAGVVQDNAQVSYYQVQNQRLLPVEDIRDATVARVDLFQDPVETQQFIFNGEETTTLPIVYSQAGQSQLHFLLERGSTGPRIVEGHYTRVVLDRESFSTYPLKTSVQAFEDLKAGEAYIANYDPNDTFVDIIEMELGYFVGGIDQGYVMPVVRFLGNNFEAYVPAISKTIEPTTTEEE